MKYHRKESANVIAVLKDLTRIIGIKISDNSFQKVKAQPSYPSMNSLIEALDDWNVAALGVKLNVSDLVNIPYPAIGHLTKNNGHFVVLQKLDSGNLYYLDPEIGLVKESLDEFDKKWTGAVLLVEANENSGEEGYEEKHKQELFIKWSNHAVWFLAFVLLILPLFFISTLVLPYYLLKLLGCAFCFILLQKQFGSSNKSIDSFCKMGTKSSCDAVIHSRASKLFGLIHLSELGLLYFVGGLFTLIIAAFANSTIPLPISIFSIILFPFTIASGYYQWRVVRAWCPLCLFVMAVIWLEVLYLYIWNVPFPISSSSIIIPLFGFMMPLLFWLLVRQRFIDSHRVPALEQKLTKFVRSEHIFQTLLSNQVSTEIFPFPHEITVGNSDAPIAITIVSNPTCGPCSFAHAVVENLLHQYDGKIKINFRFTVNRNDSTSISNQMIMHILALSRLDKDKCLKALSDWYLRSDMMDVTRWKHEHPIENLTENVTELENILYEHATWTSEVGIKTTPTLFINDKQYPVEYSLKDIKFQIGKLLKIMPVNEPVS